MWGNKDFIFCFCKLSCTCLLSKKKGKIPKKCTPCEGQEIKQGKDGLQFFDMWC